ncbi:myelin basic protein isoform X2 [Myiozetetes cayanensis]|uniref:myelin basic protein isoform X2 n=1 Tax=Myiozetetes cayanensis TaxID=478635 RepID=UPI002160F743|nr:myelin basic protein isoform X2 [Myiozetetes cayanensis]
MGNHVGKREHSADKSSKSAETKVEESAKESPKTARLTQQSSEDNEVFGEADVNQNNGTSTKNPAVTDSKGTADPKNAWQEANPADTTGRPHLIRLFSRDAPGREDNTFKDRPSESDELQTIQEDSAAASENSDLMASQKRSSFRHGSKMASASTIDHARHGSPRHRDSGLLDSLGRFFGGERHVPRRGSGKDIHAARVSHHVGSIPQRSQHGRPVDDNPVVHFFKNIVSPRTPPQCKQREEDYPSPDLAGAVKDTSQDMEAENSMSINLLTRDIRDPIMRARALFPESLNWEALGPDLDRGLVHQLLGAEALRCHSRILYSAS